MLSEQLDFEEGCSSVRQQSHISFVLSGASIGYLQNKWRLCDRKKENTIHGCGLNLTLAKRGFQWDNISWLSDQKYVLTGCCEILLF
jgi:hypothetical protein